MKTAPFGTSLNRGIYQVEFRAADWDFDGMNPDGAKVTANNALNCRQ